ncbi:MAG: hypothetical protein MK085_10550 [Phycisphaerales bacterium]|nr:hypothetical protein [Phycisphaerales bacterium]
MKTLIRTCVVAGIAAAAFTLTACDDSGDVKDVTPRKIDPNAPKIDPNASPDGSFSPMDDGANDAGGN